MIKHDYIKKLKNRNKKIKLFPRFKCVNFNPLEMQHLFSETNANLFSRKLLKILESNDFDGIMFQCLEIFLQKDLFSDFANFLRKISENLSYKNKKIILNVYPYTEKYINTIDRVRFTYLLNFVEYMNILTSDYIRYYFNENEQSLKQIYNSPISFIGNSLYYYIDFKTKHDKNLLKKIIFVIPFNGYYKDSSKIHSIPLSKSKLESLIENSEYQEEFHSYEKELLITIAKKDQYYKATFPTQNVFI